LCVGNISSSSPAAPLSDFPQTCPCVVLLIDPFSRGEVSARSLAEFVELLSLEQTTDGCVCLFFLPHTLNITSHITGLDKKNCSCLDPCVCVSIAGRMQMRTRRPT
jgi:hypothetical protein